MAGRISSFFQSVKQDSCEILQNTQEHFCFMVIRSFHIQTRDIFSHPDCLKINMLHICIYIDDVLINPRIYINYHGHT